MHDPDTLVRQFIDGDLPASEAAPALHAIADDAEARETLQFELEMTRSLAQRRSASPQRVVERTMNALPDAAPSGADAASAASDPDDAPAAFAWRLRRWWDALTTPRPVRIRPLAMLVAASLSVAVVWSTGWGAAWVAGPSPHATPPTGAPGAESTAASPPASASPSAPPATATPATAVAPTDEVVWTRFVFTDPDAQSVAVAGDFSRWEPIPLSSRTVNGQTVWTGLVPVGRGEHEYQFVVDGSEWVTDPLAPVTRDDGFGAQNAVLKL